MASGNRELMRAAIFEASFVVLGVALALMANEWRQERADQQQSRRVLTEILAELASNRAAVNESMEYHHGLLEMLRTEHEEGWVPDARQFPRGFVSPARTSRTAWLSAAETGVLPKTDFSVVLVLSGAYAQQERYEAQARSVGEIIYAELFRGGTESIARNHRNLSSIIGTLVYRERQLLEMYDETVESIEAGTVGT